jgi:UDP-N-acetylmuramyl pentapeptide phosphotransferase/UDP-N-acetylglucosamine-1-phosphate transferase
MLVGISFGIPSHSSLGAILLGACAGFLAFNWQPAKVFMGDVGSTFLGFTFAVFPLIDSTKTSESGVAPLTIAIIFLWLFLFDTAFTRLLQIIKLMPFWKAHREHLYQQIVHRGRSHQSVAMFFGLVAIASAFAIGSASATGLILLTLLLIFSPIVLMGWAWKKRLT